MFPWRTEARLPRRLQRLPQAPVKLSQIITYTSFFAQSSELSDLENEEEELAQLVSARPSVRDVPSSFLRCVFFQLNTRKTEH